MNLLKFNLPLVFGYPQGEMSPENRGYFCNFCHFLFLKTSPELFSEEEFLPLDPTQELIFPPELMVRKAAAHLPGDMSRGALSKAEGTQLPDFIRNTHCSRQGLMQTSQLVKGQRICRVLSSA